MQWQPYLAGLLTPVALGFGFYLFWRLCRALVRWYFGLPVVQWPAVGLIVLGCKLIRPRYMKTMRADGRYWFSLMCKSFEAPDDTTR